MNYFILDSESHLVYISEICSGYVENGGVWHLWQAAESAGTLLRVRWCVNGRGCLQNIAGDTSLFNYSEIFLDCAGSRSASKYDRPQVLKEDFSRWKFQDPAKALFTNEAVGLLILYSIIVTNDRCTMTTVRFYDVVNVNLRAKSFYSILPLLFAANLTFVRGRKAQ